MPEMVTVKLPEAVSSKVTLFALTKLLGAAVADQPPVEGAADAGGRADVPHAVDLAAPLDGADTPAAAGDDEVDLVGGGVVEGAGGAAGQRRG